jgi:hypothetical protein
MEVSSNHFLHSHSVDHYVAIGILTYRWYALGVQQLTWQPREMWLVVDGSVYSKDMCLSGIDCVHVLRIHWCMTLHLYWPELLCQLDIDLLHCILLCDPCQLDVVSLRYILLCDPAPAYRVTLKQPLMVPWRDCHLACLVTTPTDMVAVWLRACILQVYPWSCSKEALAAILWQCLPGEYMQVLGAVIWYWRKAFGTPHECIHTLLQVYDMLYLDFEEILQQIASVVGATWVLSTHDKEIVSIHSLQNPCP